MSHYNVNVNESPSHFMILDAIGNRGMTNINNIAKVTKLNNKTQIELIVNDLFNQRLIVKIETLDRRKKTEIRITETGLRLLNTKKQELEQKSEQIQRWYNNGDRSRLESFMGSNRAWIPMMLFSGIMNAMFFMSIMSLMGITMNPAESAMVGGGESHGNNNQNTGSVAHDNNSNEQPYHGGNEGGDYNNVGDSSGFAGFDGGAGFDSF